jgi:hypothetical protein
MRNESRFLKPQQTNISMECSTLCTQARAYAHSAAQNVELRSRRGTPSAEVRARSRAVVNVHNEIRTTSGPYPRLRRLQPPQNWDAASLSSQLFYVRARRYYSIRTVCSSMGCLFPVPLIARLLAR